MSRARQALLPLLAALAFVAVACEEDAPATVLQGIDLAKPEDSEFLIFDRNSIFESGAFTDSETLDLKTVQRFLGRTPYDRPSFLETYQSNGIRAADAIIATARHYRINPLVLLVLAQTTEGLIGERNYPFPPSRVEFVFRCGCTSATSCLPNLAGFDRQIDCLGRALRTSLDAIKADGQSLTGWGPEKTSLTFDEVKVTPATDATAVLYERIPRVNEGMAGGTWAFWNIWNLYAPKLDYVGPITMIDGKWIGESCLADESCGFEGAICAKNYPDGLCTTSCTGECPSDPSRPPSFCAKFRDAGFCFPLCNPTAPACRDGYACLRVAGVTGGLAEHVCSPKGDPAASVKP